MASSKCAQSHARMLANQRSAAAMRSSQACSTSSRCPAPVLRAPVRCRGTGRQAASLAVASGLPRTVPRAAAAVEPSASIPQPESKPQPIYSESISCPLGAVQAVMRPIEAGILSVTPEQTLQETIAVLNKVTGAPVLDKTGKVIGVISRKDIIRVRKAGGSMLEKVQKHMTSPALTVRPSTSVQEAANLMLSKNIRRLPVVDKDGKPVGLVSRSDIFKPLGNYAAVMQAEAAEMRGENSWQIKYLYDGDCPMCQSMKNLLERQDNGRGRIFFVNIADAHYSPSQNMGISYEEGMETIHAIRPDGSVVQGTDAIKAMYAAVGLGWLTWLMEQPVVTTLVELLYDFISKNRISLGQSMDVLMAGKKLDMSKQGVTTCGDVDEECAVDW